MLCAQRVPNEDKAQMTKTTDTVRHGMLCQLLLIRHGQTDMNKEGRFYGRTDSPINATGREQAVALAQRIANVPIDVAISSPLSRAYETGQIALAGRDITMLTNDLLVEMDHGSWEGLKFADARALDVTAWDRWQAGELNNPYGGETLEDMFARVETWVAQIKTTYTQGETVAVFAHGGVLQSLVCVLMGTPPRPLWQYRFGNCAIAEVELYPQGGVLVSLS